MDSRRPSQSRCSGSLTIASRSFFVGVDRQNAFRVGGFVEPRARALLFRQLVRGFHQVVLDRFERLVRQIVGAAVG